MKAGSVSFAQQSKFPEAKKLPFHASTHGTQVLVRALDSLDRQQVKALKLAPATEVV
jgi:hypothetical protein